MSQRSQVIRTGRIVSVAVVSLWCHCGVAVSTAVNVAVSVAVVSLWISLSVSLWHRCAATDKHNRVRIPLNQNGYRDEAFHKQE